MTNIKDLAKKANVSVSTVSRVLNNHPYVSGEKKTAVLKAIKESNYQQNINAVHLSRGKTFLIGVVLPFTDHPYFALLVKGIANEALKKNYKLVLIQTNYIESKEMESYFLLKQKQIDALIVCSRICKWEIIEDFLSYGPIVLCEDPQGKNISSTFINHTESFLMALDYLYKKGHRKIGYCIGRRNGTNSHARETAYLHFLETYSLPFNPQYILEDCLYFEDGELVIQQIKQMADPPSALLVTSDQVAAGIVTCAEDRDISIPENLAVGFDNQPIARIMNITTVAIPLVDMGRKLFLQSINTGEVTHEKVSTSLIERETV